MTDSGKRGIKILLVAAAISGVGYTVCYFLNLPSMIASHLEGYLLFPMFLIIAGLVLLAASRFLKTESWEWNCMLAGFIALTLSAVCFICISRIDCCSGG